MPIIPFESLPDDARLWVFAASDPVTGERAHRLLAAVDAWLADWKAHGEPLRCARDWRDDRFLAIGVDQSTAGASGCSIDALFRVLQQIQASVGTSLVGGGRVFYRSADGTIVATSRAELSHLASAGSLKMDTKVFDTSVTDLAAYREAFEVPMQNSWHRHLVEASPAPAPAPSTQHQHAEPVLVSSNQQPATQSTAPDSPAQTHRR